MSKLRPIGYVLLRQYPGCNKGVGYFEKYTTGEFSNYPNIWQPIYSKMQTNRITETHTIEITVTTK